jgi:hypothetical protein
MAETMTAPIKRKKFDFGPKVHVKFQNIENPKAGIDFNFEGRKFSLQDGEELDLPQAVVDHLNSLQVPNPHFEIDPKTGQGRSVTTYNNRFAVIPTRKAA